MRPYFRDDPNRPLEIDVSWAIERFTRHQGRCPERLIVPTSQVKEFLTLKDFFEVDIVESDRMMEGWFQVK